MAGKISKTARASMLDRVNNNNARSCPQCGESLVATKVIKSPGQPGGMFWVCSKDETRIRI